MKKFAVTAVVSLVLIGWFSSELFAQRGGRGGGRGKSAPKAKAKPGPAAGKPGAGPKGKPGPKPGTSPGLTPAKAKPGLKPGLSPKTLPGKPGTGLHPRPAFAPGYWHGWKPGPHWHWHRCHYRPWAWASWAAVGTWIGTTASPVSYNYYVSDGTVYNGDTPVGTAEEQAQAAEDLAGTAQEQKDDGEWMPLGVFAVVPTPESKVEVTVQLAMAKDGTVGGSYHNSALDVTLPVTGAVDKQSQKVAWKVGEEDADAVVMETGLDSLTKDTSSVLLHFAGGVTEAWTLIRLDEEAAKAAEAEMAAPPGNN
jgi:hypothetical protein